MNDPEKPHVNGAADPASAPAPEAAAPPLEPEPPLVDPFTALELERDGLKDKLLRTLADMENLRRRSEREAADSRQYGITGFARDALTVADNLRRALDSIPPDARAAAEGPFKALIDGVEVTERDLIATLERHKVKRIEPLGQKFDPNLHQAMFEAPDAAHAKGMVMTVAQPGYSIGERVLRPALVGVSSGPPKA